MNSAMFRFYSLFLSLLQKKSTECSSLRRTVIRERSFVVTCGLSFKFCMPLQNITFHSFIYFIYILGFGCHITQCKDQVMYRSQLSRSFLQFLISELKKMNSAQTHGPALRQASYPIFEARISASCRPLTYPGFLKEWQSSPWCLDQSNILFSEQAPLKKWWVSISPIFKK